MELSVLDKNGKDTGRKIVLQDSIFGIEPNEHVVWLDVKRYLAAQRQGTHKSKERSELSGSTRKLIRQKGSGGARRGDINSPLLVGGARVFGPRPRNYTIKINKKVKDLARRSVLSSKAKEGAIVVVEDLHIETPQTKEIVSLTRNLQLADKKILLVLPNQNKNVYLSARNLKKVNVMVASDVNTYKLIDNNCLLFTESSVNELNKLFIKD